MKLSTAVLGLVVGSVSAFTAPSTIKPLSTARNAATLSEHETSVAPAAVEEKSETPLNRAVTDPMNVEMPLASEEVDCIEPGRYNDKKESIALPFLKRPSKLDGSHAGDNGFDPLGLSEQFDLYTMQEAEIRHARLAMLAVVGWPLSELVAPEWMLQENGCAPSVLNGFNPATFLATLAVFAGLGFFEYKTALRTTYNTEFGRLHEKDYSKIWEYGVAGDYSFDPLNLYPTNDDAYARKGARDVEISHGRMAMLGITYFAMWEALTGHPIVDNSMFFHPNILFPALVAGYVGFNVVYQVESNDQYLFQISKTSEGDAIVENLKLQFPDSEASSENSEKLYEVAEATKEFASKLKSKTLELWKQYEEYYEKNIA